MTPSQMTNAAAPSPASTLTAVVRSSFTGCLRIS
jgi:hypothetical protein